MIDNIKNYKEKCIIVLDKNANFLLIVNLKNKFKKLWY